MQKLPGKLVAFWRDRKVPAMCTQTFAHGRHPPPAQPPTPMSLQPKPGARKQL